MQKGFEIVPFNGNYHASFDLLFLLLSLKQRTVLEKSGGRGDLIEIPNSKRGKMVFTLLNKILAVYVKLTSIHVRCFSSEESFLELVKVPQYRVFRLYNHFEYLL